MKNTKTIDNFENWSKSLENMDFDQFSLTIKNKILESNMDNDSKQLFNDCFEYTMKQYKSNKPLDVNLLKIYLEEIKNYKNIKLQEFINILLLLTYCGFGFYYNKEKL